jgi:hypothetical protein
VDIWASGLRVFSEYRRRRSCAWPWRENENLVLERGRLQITVLDEDRVTPGTPEVQEGIKRGWDC